MFMQTCWHPFLRTICKDVKRYTVLLNLCVSSSLRPFIHFLLFLLQFSVFLGIIFFLELTAGVLAFVFKDWIKDQLYFFINSNIKAYRDDIDLQNLIDFTQEYVRMTETFAWLKFICLYCSRFVTLLSQTCDFEIQNKHNVLWTYLHTIAQFSSTGWSRPQTISWLDSAEQLNIDVAITLFYNSVRMCILSCLLCEADYL